MPVTTAKTETATGVYELVNEWVHGLYEHGLYDWQPNPTRTTGYNICTVNTKDFVDAIPMETISTGTINVDNFHFYDTVWAPYDDFPDKPRDIRREEDEDVEVNESAWNEFMNSQ